MSDFYKKINFLVKINNVLKSSEDINSYAKETKTAYNSFSKLISEVEKEVDMESRIKEIDLFLENIETIRNSCTGNLVVNISNADKEQLPTNSLQVLNMTYVCGINIEKIPKGGA